MLVLDLRAVLFGILLLLVVAVGAAILLLRRKGGTRGTVLPLVDAAPFGVLVFEGDRCIYSNHCAERLVNISSGERELPGAEWAQLLAEDRVATRRAPSGSGRQRTVVLTSARVVRWWVVPYAQQDVVFLLDITAQQRTEQAGHALINDLAHELRTPIATILTHLEVLGLEDVDAELRHQSLTLSKEEAQRMVRLVNDMLELGRLETAPALARRPLDLGALVEDVVLQVTPRAVERQMDLALEVEPGLPLFNGDTDRLRQVLLNLLDNAFKYARSGDHVHVSLSREPEGIVCSVCDSGPGIPEEHLPYVSRRFYRVAPRAVEGSGLGLSVVAEILQRHESCLEIESHTGEDSGTCVRFVLPVKQ